MSIYRNGAEVQLELPDHAPTASRPMIRPVPLLEGATGRLFTTSPGEFGPESTGLRVTERGHWYRTDGWYGLDGYKCRGCGAVGPDCSSLDEYRCAKPASAQDIAWSLFASVPRPAPAEMHAQQSRIRFIRTAVAA